MILNLNFDKPEKQQQNSQTFRVSFDKLSARLSLDLIFWFCFLTIVFFFIASYSLEDILANKQASKQTNKQTNCCRCCCFRSAKTRIESCDKTNPLIIRHTTTTTNCFSGLSGNENIVEETQIQTQTT